MFRKLNVRLIDENTKLKNNRFLHWLFIFFYSNISGGCMVCGILPQFLSFQRIFYIEDTAVFLGLYIGFLYVFLQGIIGFMIMSYIEKVFIKKRYILMIIFGYILIFGLLCLDAYLFTSFKITETGYEVPFNILLFIIDILVIFPLWFFYTYFLQTFLTRKIAKRKNNLDV